MSASEKLQHVQQQVQQTAAQLPSKVEHTVKSLVPADREHLVDEGKAVIKRYANLPFSFSMENDISKARNIVKNLKDFPAWVDGGLVSDQIKRADAVAFLTTARLGFVLTGQFGTGLVLSKISEDRWSAPSAIAYIGSGVGFQGGMDLTDYVIILTKAGLESFKSTAQLVLSGDMGLTLMMGRHGSADLHLGKKVGVALGWAASKGMYVGASAQAGVIVTRNGANKKFYGKDVSPDDILSGRVSQTYGGRRASSCHAAHRGRSGLRRPIVMMTRAVMKPGASVGAAARPISIMIRGGRSVLGSAGGFTTEQAPTWSSASSTRGFATASPPSSEALLLSPRFKKHKIFREIEALGENRDLEGLLELASSRAKELTPANASHLLNRLAKLGSSEAMSSDQRFKSFVTFVHSKIHQEPTFFRARQVRDIAHATAKLHPESSQQLGASIVEYVRRRGVQELDPEAIGDVFSALAKLGYDPGDEFKSQVVDDLRCKGPHNFDPKTIARNAKELADSSSHAMERRRGENWSEKTLASVVDGLRYVVPRSIEGLPSDAVPRAELSRFKPRDIANIVTALVKFGHDPGEAFMGEVMKDVRRRGVHEFDLMDLLKLVHALAKLGHHPGEDLLENVVNHLQQNGLVEGYNYVQAEKLTKAFVKLGYGPGERLFE